MKKCSAEEFDQIWAHCLMHGIKKQETKKKECQIVTIITIIIIIIIICNFYPNGLEFAVTQKLRWPSGLKMFTAAPYVLKGGTPPWSMHICYVKSWSCLVEGTTLYFGTEVLLLFISLDILTLQYSMEASILAGRQTATRRNGGLVSKC